jgi:hypothetical protein
LYISVRFTAWHLENDILKVFHDLSFFVDVCIALTMTHGVAGFIVGLADVREMSTHDMIARCGPIKGFDIGTWIGFFVTGGQWSIASNPPTRTARWRKAHIGLDLRGDPWGAQGFS